jgi:hypothetical protein
MRVETRFPDEQRILTTGEMTAIAPGEPQRVSGTVGDRFKFLIIQRVGDYDYVPEGNG